MSGIIQPAHSKTKSIVIESLVFRATGTYAPQFFRPYVMNPDFNNMNGLVDAVAQSVAGRTQPAHLAGVVGGMFSISGSPESLAPVPIANGWDTQRATFMMTVRCMYQTGGSIQYQIQGHTDHFGINKFTNSIDPMMVLHINNIVTLRNNQQHSMNGAFEQSVVIANNHLIYDQNDGGFDDGNTKSLLRPFDIYQMTDANAVQAGGEGTLFNTSNAVNRVPKMSRRGNDVATNYATQLINTCMNVSSQAYMSDNDQALAATGASHLRESMPTSNDFLTQLAHYSTTGMVNGSFRWRDLLKLDSSIESRTDFVEEANNGGFFDILNSPDQTMQWHGSDKTTEWASTLAHAIPALMSQCGLGHVVFAATNRKTGVGEIAVMDGNSLGTGDPRSAILSFEQRVLFEVLNDLSLNDMFSYEVIVSCSLTSETKMEISVETHEVYPYAAPTFCDALYAPVITTNVAYSSHLADDMFTLVRDVTGQIQADRTLVAAPQRPQILMPGTNQFNKTADAISHFNLTTNASF